VKIIIAALIFILIIIAGNYLAKKEFKKGKGKPPEDVYPLF
jgi:uncharacterized protein YneF (UPF0154 family)